MRKTLKLVGWLILGLFVANLVSWAVIGRESSLVLASELVENDYGAWMDTLFVYKSLSIEGGLDGDQIGAFSDRTKQALFNRLESATGSVIRYVDETTYEPFDSTELRFWAWIHRSIPMWADVTSAESSLGFACDYRQRWVWVFGWTLFGEGRGSTS